MPLFHTRIVPLNVKRHAGLRLNRAAGFGFAAGSETIPIGLGEFEAATYPIVFSEGPQPRPVVILGYRDGWNMFVNEAGAWMPGQYVPALVRAFPFAFIGDPETGERVVGIEADAACLGPATGEALFENDQPSAAVRDAVAFAEAAQADLAEGESLAAALDAAGVLAPQEVTIEAHAGGAARIAGFRTIDRARLAAVSDEIFLEWRRRNWLLPIYAHLISQTAWVPFTEFASQQLATRR